MKRYYHQKIIISVLAVLLSFHHMKDPYLGTFPTHCFNFNHPVPFVFIRRMYGLNVCFNRVNVKVILNLKKEEQTFGYQSMNNYGILEMMLRLDSLKVHIRIFLFLFSI